MPLAPAPVSAHHGLRSLLAEQNEAGMANKMLTDLRQTIATAWRLNLVDTDSNTSTSTTPASRSKNGDLDCPAICADVADIALTAIISRYSTPPNHPFRTAHFANSSTGTTVAARAPTNSQSVSGKE